MAITKGKGIRNRLIVSFFIVIATMFALDVLFFFVHIALIKQYQDVTNNMITEYQVVTTSDNLVNSYNETVKLIQDPHQAAKYNAIVGQINAVFAKLDTTITSAQSKAAYAGLKNTVQNLIAQLNSGIGEAQAGNISATSVDYDGALQKEDFVRQNDATLIFDELGYTEQIQADIAHDELLSEIIGGLLILLLSIAALLYSIIFSKKLTAPLINLATLAENIAGGNLGAAVDSDLLAATDEVGSLANSFNVMVQSLRENIYALDSEKKVVEEKVKMRTRELVEERAQLLASINGLPLGFLLLDTTDTILLSNRMVQGLFPSGEFTLASFSNAFDPVLNISEINRLVLTKQPYDIPEAKMGERSFHVTVVPVVLPQPGKEDDVIGSVVLVEDITQEKTLEKSKDTFLSIAAHEMRTPLTIIRGNTELLSDEAAINASAELKERIESILRSAIRLLNIVNEFLDVQNLESSRITLNAEPIDIGALLTETVRDLSTLSDQKGLSLTFNAPPDLGTLTLNADKYRLQQVLTNLISNAIHYTEHGGITVTLQKEEEFLKIRFEDTGIGIDSEEQGRLFKKFETGRVFMQSKEYGSGLGLYISRFIAHLMGGDLVLEKSEAGKGSVFCLTLPLGASTGLLTAPAA